MVDAAAKVNPTVKEAASYVASAVVSLRSKKFTFSNKTGVVNSVIVNNRTGK